MGSRPMSSCRKWSAAAVNWSWASPGTASSVRVSCSGWAAFSPRSSATSAFRRAPLERADALAMLDEIKGRKILNAVRGMEAADRGQLADMLVAVGQIGVEIDQVREIDLNPVILSGSSPVVVDALIILE